MRSKREGDGETFRGEERKGIGGRKRGRRRDKSVGEGRKRKG